MSGTASKSFFVYLFLVDFPAMLNELENENSSEILIVMSFVRIWKTSGVDGTKKTTSRSKLTPLVSQVSLHLIANFEL